MLASFPQIRLDDHWIRLNRGRISLDFRRVPYDVAAYVRKLRTCGRPHAEEAIAQLRIRD